MAKEFLYAYQSGRVLKQPHPIYPFYIQVKSNAKAIKVYVPSPERFTVHKILTYSLRKNPAKKYKDAYYAYYILRYHPDREKLLKKIGTVDLGQETTQIKKILKDILPLPMPQPFCK